MLIFNTPSFICILVCKSDQESKQTSIREYRTACTHTHPHVCNECTYKHIYILRHRYTHTPVPNYTCIRTYTYIHTYIHACMHAYIHTYIYTCIHTQTQCVCVCTKRKGVDPCGYSVCVYMYTHTRVHMPIHTYLHTYIYGACIYIYI